MVMASPRTCSGLAYSGVMGRAMVVSASPAGVENLRNSEIEQLGYAVAGDENVAGLDVAMNHQALMRILDGARTPREKCRRRSVTESRCAWQYASMRSPSMSSITR